MGSTDQIQNIGEGLTEEELMLLIIEALERVRSEFDGIRQDMIRHQDMNQAFDGIHSELDGLRRDMQEGHDRRMRLLDDIHHQRHLHRQFASAVREDERRRPRDFDRSTGKWVRVSNYG